MTVALDTSAMWILERDGAIATAVVRVRGTRLEVLVYRDSTLLGSQMFDSGADASAWARTERDRMITEEGWRDTRTPAGSFRSAAIVLYQPDTVFSACGVDVSTFASYVKVLVETTVRAHSTVTAPQPLDIVVAVRTRRRSRVWPMPAPTSIDVNVDGLRKSLEQVPPPHLTNGLLVFALNGALADGKRRRHHTTEGYRHPIPDEWKAAMDDAATIEDLVNRTWPDAGPGLFKRWFRP